MADKWTQAALDYADEILSDNIPSCEYVRQAVERFVDDLGRPDLYYDAAAVAHCGAFIENLCHVSGEWRGKPLEMSPYQCFVVANIYGLKYNEKYQDGALKGIRKYKKSYIEVPRKNGKSTWAAALCLYGLSMDGEPGAEVYCAASNEKQAHKVFDPARHMLNNDDQLREWLGLTVYAKSIFNDREALSFKPVIGDPDDGDSPHFAVIDEYHEHEHDRAYTTFKTGVGSRRRAHLMVITTAGDNIDGPCHRLRGDIIEILAGSVTDRNADRTFGIIYTIRQDADKNHWTTEEALWEANPNIGYSTTLEHLLEEQAEAIRTRTAQSAFKTKHLNIWIGQSDPWIDMNAWGQNGWTFLPTFKNYADVETRPDEWPEDGDPDEEIVSPDDPRVFDKLKHLPCIVVTDLSARNDFTACVVVFYQDDRKSEPVEMPDGTKRYKRIYWAVPFFWLPRATFDKVARYEPWEKYITLHEGEEIDLLRVAATISGWLENDLLAKEYVTDPYRSSGVEQTIGESVVWTEIVRFGQGAAPYTNAMYELQAAIDSGRFRHPDNPVLNWMAGNLPFKRTDENNVKPVRPKDDAKKIDGAVCCVMGAGRAMAQDIESGPPKLGSVSGP